MKKFQQQFLNSLTPGVSVLIALLGLVYLAVIAAKMTGTADLLEWIPLTGPQFRNGQVWRVVTYALVPAGIVDFIMNGFVLILLGVHLERHQSRGALWMICIFAALGGGLAKVTIQWSSTSPLVGATPIVYGLLAAWCLLFGHERIMVPPIGEIFVWQLTLLAGAVSFLVMALSTGLSDALVFLGGGVSGWFYVWLRRKWFMRRTARTVHSERIARLEL